ncbi:hypothetical protein Taro_025798, partial [Colocasia esculenta]|nr:hypothetical protein [Colocasia esculenta]
GVVAGPFVRGCETERWICVVCSGLWLVSRTSSRDSCVAYPFVACTRVVVCRLLTCSYSIMRRCCYIFRCFTTLHIITIVL